VRVFLRHFIFCFLLINANSLFAQKKNAKVPLVKFHKDNSPNVELFGQFIDEWLGNMEQTDDVLVMGVRV
jgi:hypothetical protein